MLDDYIKYYATYVLQMGKSKINTYEHATRNDPIGSLKQNVMEQTNLLKPSNTKVDNINK